MTQPALNSRLALILNADAQARDLLTRYRAATSEASRRIGADGRLSTEGKADALRTALAGVRQTFGTEIADLIAQVNGAVEALQRTAAALLPKPQPGVEGLLGRQAWWARTRSLLDAGVRPQDVIASTHDFEQLFSLREELPTAIQAGITTCPGGADAALLVVDRRLAELMSPAALKAHDDARTAEVAAAGVMPNLQYASVEVTGQAPEGGGLTSAVAGQLARQFAALRLRPIESDDAA